MSALKLEKEWESKMKVLKDSQSATLDAALSAAHLAFNKQLSELTNSHNKALSQLNERLLQATNGAASDAKHADEQNVLVLTQLEEEKASHISDVDDLNKRNREDRDEAEDRRRRELEALRSALTTASEERERLAAEGHETVVALMKSLAEKVEGRCNL